MKKYEQLITSKNAIGDCFRTAIGCILEVPPENLPHYTTATWLEDWQDFLGKYGLTLRNNSFQRYYRGAGYAIASVPSLNLGKKVEHAVITYRGELVWDVSPYNKRRRLRKISEIIYFEALDPSKVHLLQELR